MEASSVFRQPGLHPATITLGAPIIAVAPSSSSSRSAPRILIPHLMAQQSNGAAPARGAQWPFAPERRPHTDRLAKGNRVFLGREDLEDHRPAEPRGFH